MRGNLLGIFFSILSGVLIFLIVVAYGRSDRIAPEFRFSATDTIYNSQTADNDLKVGINAYDAKDGDLTGRIVVEKVVLNREKETAVVYYAVADYSGNVTKQSRVFPADIEDIDKNANPSDYIEEEETVPFPDMSAPVIQEEGTQDAQEAGEENPASQETSSNQG